MVWYIRFVKYPRIEAAKSRLHSILTITTDLGDDFLPWSLQLTGRFSIRHNRHSDTGGVERGGEEAPEFVRSQEFTAQWTEYARELSVTIPLAPGELRMLDSSKCHGIFEVVADTAEASSEQEEGTCTSSAGDVNFAYRLSSHGYHGKQEERSAIVGVRSDRLGVANKSRCHVRMFEGIGGEGREPLVIHEELGNAIEGHIW